MPRLRKFESVDVHTTYDGKYVYICMYVYTSVSICSYDDRD